METGKRSEIPVQDLWPRSVQQTLCLVLCGGLLVLTGYALGRHSQAMPAGSAGMILDLNHSSPAQLQNLPGIGEKLAQRIVEHRQSHGQFASVEGLRQVPGIGSSTLDRLRPFIAVSDNGPTAQLAPFSVQPKTAKEAGLQGTVILLNEAEAAELQKLPGIGPTLSQRIVDYRKEKGRFQTLDDLRKVQGIGPKILDRIRPYLVLERKSALAAAN